MAAPFLSIQVPVRFVPSFGTAVRTKNSVLTELVEFRQPSLYLFGDMLTIILSLFSSASQVF